MKNALFLLVFLLPGTQMNAQNRKKTFEEIFYNVAVNVTGRDSRDAIRIADSLYHSASSTAERARSSMLKANVYASVGELEKAVGSAMQALSIAEDGGLIYLQPKILGFLSTQYRNMGLLKKGRVCLEKGMRLSRALPDRKKSLSYYGLALQEEAYYEHDENANARAVVALGKADSVFRQLEDSGDKLFFLATNEEMLGRELLILGNPSQSLSHYRRSEYYIDRASATESGLLGFVYNGKGEAHSRLGQLDSAFYYYKKALGVAERSEHANLLPTVYSNLADYYSKTGNIKKFRVFATLKDSIVGAQNLRNQKVSDNIVERLSLEAGRSKLSALAILLLLALLLISLSAMYFLNTAKKRKIREKARLALENFGHFPVTVPEGQVYQEEIPLVLQDAASQYSISPDTEQLLLKKLERFEKKKKFIDRNVSLTSLSASMGTNSKYLSHLIKKSRGSDFSGYINRLRIRYIVDKMRADPDYLNYKLSYLAEECGFSSHSKFSSTFKSIVGVSPSGFISYLREENRLGAKKGK